jgi:hypothetical protein
VRAWLLTLVAALLCAAFALSALADPPRRRIDVSRALDAGGPLPDVVIKPIPADPPPMVERQQWVFDLRWDRGDVWLLGVHALELPAPQATPRAMGRFALELYEGPALIERVRFDFPLLGAPDPEDAAPGTPSFTKNLRSRVGVVFPATARGTRLELWDRATDRRWSLAWPPQSGAADGGTDAGDAALSPRTLRDASVEARP